MDKEIYERALKAIEKYHKSADGMDFELLVEAACEMAEVLEELFEE
jgi:hypothetical protein